MSIASRADHRVLVWRNLPAQNELGDNDDDWQPIAVPAGLNAHADLAWSGLMQDRGPGEQQAAYRRWFLVLGFDVRERDVLEVVEGQEAGKLLKVHSVMKGTNYLGLLRHYEVNVEVWSGSVHPVPEVTS